MAAGLNVTLKRRAGEAVTVILNNKAVKISIDAERSSGNSVTLNFVAAPDVVIFGPKVGEELDRLRTRILELEKEIK